MVRQDQEGRKRSRDTQARCHILCVVRQDEEGRKRSTDIQARCHILYVIDKTWSAGRGLWTLKLGAMFCVVASVLLGAEGDGRGV